MKRASRHAADEGPRSAEEAAFSRSSTRALQLFEAFRSARRPLSLSELARLADMPVSTCHGVMRTLEQSGFLYFVSGRDVYPTRKLWEIAEDIRAHDPITLRLEPALAALRDDVDETVILGARQGDAALYLLVLESRQSIRYSARAGELKPLHSSAIGKTLLGSLSDEALDAWLAGRTLARITEHTITSRAALRADLAASRKRGWYMTGGENVADVVAIAAPLRVGSTVLGLAVAGPAHRMRPAHERIADALARCVRRLETDDVR